MTLNQGGWPSQPGRRQGWQQPAGWSSPQAWPQQPGGRPQGPTAWQQPGVGTWQQPVGAYPPGTQRAPGHLPTPPRKKSSAGTVLLVAVGAVVLLGLGIAFLGGAGETGGGIAYQNESYTPPPADLNPPPLPVPETVSEAQAVLTKNKLYSQVMPQPIRCDVSEIDLMKADNATLKKHMEDVVACLMRSWVVPVENAGYKLPRPSVTVYETPITTKCGKLPMPNAVYCGADQQVYYSKDLPTIVPASLRSSRFVVESVVAHEFGHAIQARTAILISSSYFEKNAASTALANEWSRRTEVQADCFAGMFLRSVSQSAGMNQTELDNVLKLFAAIGDDSLSGKPGIDGGHGLAATRRYWGEMGLASTKVEACNTFSADSASVR